jgi:hypothetical protein
VLAGAAAGALPNARADAAGERAVRLRGASGEPGHAHAPGP